MLDTAYIRDHMDEVRTGLRNRGLDPDKTLEDIATLETARRRMIPELEALKRAQNTSGDEIARAKRQGHDTAPVQEANRTRACRSGKARKRTSKCAATANRARSISSRSRTGIWDLRSASSTSSAGPRLQEHASPC